MYDGPPIDARARSRLTTAQRVLMVLPVAIGIMGLSTTFLMLWPAVALPGDREALGYSVAESAGSGMYAYSGSSGTCRPIREGIYDCAVSVPDGDSSTRLAAYRVSVGTFGCWTAVPASDWMSVSDDGTSGCLGIRDFYHPPETTDGYD